MSGYTKSLEEISNALKINGLIRTSRKMEHVSAPFHSPLLQPAAQSFSQYLQAASFAEPHYNLIRNVTGKSYIDGDNLKIGLMEQIVKTVRWRDCVNWCLDVGVDRFVEMGPGNVLSKLFDRELKDQAVHGVKVESIDGPSQINR